MSPTENLAVIRLQSEEDPVSLGLLSLYEECQEPCQRQVFLALANLRNKGAGESFARIMLLAGEFFAQELKAQGKLRIAPEKES